MCCRRGKTKRSHSFYDVSRKRTRKGLFNLRSSILGTRQGQWGAIFMSGWCMLGFCMLLWVLSGGNADYGTSFRDSLWIAYTLLVDIGTQTGFAPSTSADLKFIAAVISIMGFIYALIFFGVLVQVTRETLDYCKDKFSTIDTSKHLLILGWGDKTLFLLDELLSTAHREQPRGCCRRRRQIVILAKRPVREMWRDVSMHLRLKQSEGISSKMKMMSFRQGSRDNKLDLQKVSASDAEDILVMCESETGRASDHEAIQSLLALGNLASDSPLAGEVHAEMHSRESAESVRVILPAAKGIVARQAVNHMMVLRALVPNVGYALLEMASFRKDNQLYLVPVPETLQGLTFKDVGKLFPMAVVCGVLPHKVDARSLPLMPSGGLHKLAEGDRLLLLGSAASAHVPYADFQTPEPSKLATWAQGRGPCPSVFAPDGQVRLGPSADGHLIVMLIGCPGDFADILHIIDVYVASGSEVHVLSDKDIAWREYCLNQYVEQYGQFERITVKHYLGNRRDPSALGQLPLHVADCALILSEREGPDDTPMSMDSTNLTAAVNLKHLLVSGAAQEKRNASRRSVAGDYRKKCKLVTEILDTKSEIVLDKNDSVRKTGSFVYTSAMETGVFAIAVSSRARYDVFMRLIDPKGNAGYVIAAPIADYVQGEKEDLSYFDLQERVFASCNGILLGWRRSNKRHSELNPEDKHDFHTWSKASGDELLILRPPLGEARAPVDGECGVRVDSQGVPPPEGSPTETLEGPPTETVELPDLALLPNTLPVPDESEEAVSAEDTT
eukprot:TRINITY_DN48469_c0_g1_i1.p1 TRINITY_DN48469_c0_g1~~TRINITY_DN48469_c0_g1_i1.p1  ORF type:complete len:804 (+),score=110.32 TRINITY_DN48469_c0_g1_i1:63-2414(+)